MKYSWMMPLTLLIAFIGGSIVDDNLILGTLIIFLGFGTLALKWHLQDKIRNLNQRGKEE